MAAAGVLLEARTHLLTALLVLTAGMAPAQEAPAPALPFSLGLLTYEDARRLAWCSAFFAYELETAKARFTDPATAVDREKLDKASNDLAAALTASQVATIVIRTEGMEALADRGAAAFREEGPLLPVPASRACDRETFDTNHAVRQPARDDAERERLRILLDYITMLASGR